MLALTCMAAAQSTSTQQPASKTPAASAGSTTSAAAEPGSASGVPAATVEVDPVPVSMAIQATPPNKKHAEAKATQMDPEDPNKSPYWDRPRRKDNAEAGGADVILSTSNSNKSMVDSIQALRPDGRLVTMGVDAEPLPLSLMDLIGKRIRIIGSQQNGPEYLY